MEYSRTYSVERERDSGQCEGETARKGVHQPKYQMKMFHHQARPFTMDFRYIFLSLSFSPSYI